MASLSYGNGDSNSDVFSFDSVNDPFYCTADEILSAKVNKFGWSVFSKRIQLGSLPSTIVVAAKQLKNNAELTEYSTKFEQYSITSGTNFLTYKKMQSVHDYGVFSFLISDNECSLATLVREHKKNKEFALYIFRQLLSIINEHRNSEICRTKYKPLFCICEENVYVTFDDSKKNILNIRLLPLPSSADTDAYNTLLFKTPANASSSEGLAADVFAAALLYFRMRYDDGDTFEDDPKEEAIEKCLSLFAQRRPSFDELLVAFEINTLASHEINDTHTTGTTGSGSISSGQGTSSGNNTYIKEDEERIKISVKTPSAFKGIAAFFKKIGDFFKKLFSNFMKEEPGDDSTIFPE